MNETTYKIKNEHTGIDIEVIVYDQGDGQIGGGIISNLIDDDDQIQTAFDAVESFILAAACAGIDVSEAAFKKAVETTVDAIFSNLG